MVFGRRDGNWYGVQCKCRRTFPESRLTESEVRAEVAAAREFAQPLETLVIATTAPPDTQLQAMAMGLESLGELARGLVGEIRGRSLAVELAAPDSEYPVVEL